MAVTKFSGRFGFFQSIIFKNVLLFLLILLVAVVPLALRYYLDSRDYEIQNQASKLEFFAERGASWINVAAIPTLARPEHMRTPAYHNLVNTLSRIEQEFDVDNAIVMRRETDGRYTYVAVGEGVSSAASQSSRTIRNPCNPTPDHTVRNPCTPTAPVAGLFDIGRPVHIHPDFPATYKATEDTWQAGDMMHSQLFGGQIEDQIFDQFLQINTPLKLNGQVVAILMLNKFANPVAAAVRTKTIRVVGLTVIILAVGLGLFGYASARMLRPLKNLTASAGEVAQGNLETAIPPPRSRDEVGRLTAAFGTMIEGLRQRDSIRHAFGRYLSEEVVNELLGSPDGLKIGGELREVTFLVSDLRGFTSMTVRLSPQEIIHILNRYLERMVEIIGRYRGTVDEFNGDGILAFFGAPLMAGDDPERAIACAIAMQSALEELNAELRRCGFPELAMGIGLSTGDVIVGNIGSEKRAKYGAVGSAINTAYRIESYTVGGQILIGPETYERVRSLLQVRSSMTVQFKGLDAPISIYDVTGLQGRYACFLPAGIPEVFVPLAVPLPITCYVIEDKTVSEQVIAGTITRIAASAAQVVLDNRIPLHTNLKFVMTAPETAGLSEVYAKVLEIGPHRDGAAHPSLGIGFTSLPDDVKAFLERRAAASSHTV